MATPRDQNGRRSKWDNPVPNSPSATEAAREAARKLNAMLAAKGKLNTNTVPPLRAPVPRSTAGASNDSNSSSEMFTEEVEINDSPRRLLLCKGTVQYEINKYSGAAISTKGQYIPGSEKANFAGQRPLYLFIQSPSREKVNLAVKRIHEILRGEDPFSAPPVAPANVSNPYQVSQSPALPSGMHYVQEKVFVGLDNVPPEFNLKEKIVGPGETYFQHITRETGAKVQLRGRGSGFIEPTSGREAFEALYIYISHNSYAGLGAAKKLVENLIQTVTSAYQTFQMQHSSKMQYSGYGGPRVRPPQHPPMYTPGVPGYGTPPRPRGVPPYPPYPQPPNQYPRYSQPQPPLPNHYIRPEQPPSSVFSPNAPSITEGPRPLMNDQPPQYGSPYPPAQNRQPVPYVPAYPPTPRPGQHKETVQSNDNSKQQQPLAAGNPGEVGNKPSTLEEKPPDPPKRRFTEAPAKKPVPAQASDYTTEKQRSVSSLDQPSPPLLDSSDMSDVVHMGAMPPPALPASKGKPAGKAKQNDASLPGVFKTPTLPASVSISATKKNLPSPANFTGKKRKLEEPDTKSSGFALLGSYDDSSDEDDEETTKRLGNKPS